MVLKYFNHDYHVDGIGCLPVILTVALLPREYTGR